jgi:hypothetical protein
MAENRSCTYPVVCWRANKLKGTVSRDFRLLVFFMDQFPPSIWVYHYGHFEFFENSRRYSLLKVHHRCQPHRWQMEKIFKQKNFNNFVKAPLGSRVNIYINFCLQFHFKVSAAWYCSHYLPPVSTTQGEPVAKFAAGVVDTGGKFAAGVVDTAAICHRCHWQRWKICHRCRWHRWCTLTCEYIFKKFEMILMLFSGTWGKVIHEKNLKPVSTTPVANGKNLQAEKF